MDPGRQSVVTWVAREILPHEGIVRNWLSRRWGHALNVDDVLQEAYCRLSELDSTAHIRSPRAYFFATVRTVAIDLLRAAKVANLHSMTEIEWENVMDGGSSPDAVAEASQELSRVREMLAGMSPTCRRVIELRRLDGLSQAETARQLGVNECVVENHVSRGIRKLLKAMAEQPPQEQTEDEPGWTSPIRQTGRMSRRRSGRRALRSGS